LAPLPAFRSFSGVEITRTRAISPHLNERPDTSLERDIHSQHLDTVLVTIGPACWSREARTIPDADAREVVQARRLAGEILLENEQLRVRVRIDRRVAARCEAGTFQES
jgi:hypothetical protein